MPDIYELKEPVAGFNFNPDQQEAIHFKDGAMLVLAGPGSGKTAVITQRIRYLIQECRIPPGQILVITFTKAAALEMKNRCYRICEDSVQSVFGTFHSIFYQILKNSKQYQNYSIITTYEKREMMKEILSVYGYESIQLAQIAEQMLLQISQCKNRKHEEEVDDQLSRIREAYERECRIQKVMDYDDILILCHELLENNAKERLKWQSRFRYILVDEFQDVNHIQYEVISLLSEKTGNIFAVGDDDQAIYAFRGSDPFYMKQFLLDFPQSKQVCLSMNYRCGDKIVKAASKCISNNKNRFRKEFIAVSENNSTFIVKDFNDRNQELDYICNKIRQMKENECIAILLRTNTKTEYMAEWLYKQKIPCNIIEKRNCFYELPYIMDILSVLKFCFLEPARQDFLTFMNKPARHISREFLTDEIVKFDMLKKFYKDNKSVLHNIEVLERNCDFLRSMDSFAGITFILNGMGYLKYLKEQMSGDSGQYEEVLVKMEELKQKSRQFKTVNLFLNFVDEYCKDFHNQKDKGYMNAKYRGGNMNKSANVDKSANMDKRVSLMTYHSSKGLEFDHVFLPEINRGEVPHGRALSKEELEEERRMFYVAMTRAKKSLTITYVSDPYANSSEKSVFVRELSGVSLKNVPTK